MKCVFRKEPPVYKMAAIGNTDSTPDGSLRNRRPKPYKALV